MHQSAYAIMMIAYVLTISKQYYTFNEMRMKLLFANILYRP